MIKEAIDRVLDLAAPQIIVNEDGYEFSNKQLHRVIVDNLPAPKALTLHTLSGLVDYVKSGQDHATHYLIHVADYNKVFLYGEYEPTFGRRKVFVEVDAITPEYPFGRYLDQETFIIHLQSMFQNYYGDIANLLKIAGTVEEGTTKTSADDGVSQTVQAKAGVVTKAEIKVPNPVSLAPYRTFPEIEPTKADFVFRIQSGPKFALFQADGDAWRLGLIKAIKAWLQEQLSGDESVSIIG